MNKKKLLALLMALVMTFSLVPVTALATEEQPAPASDNFYVDSEDSSLYHIANLAGLREFRDSVNGGNTYKDMTVQLDANIDLSEDVDDNDDQISWVPIGNNAAGNPKKDTSGIRFDGSFNGNNYTISNLMINDPNLVCAGLFGIAQSGEISNLRLNNVDITAKSWIGSVVGFSYSDISNCHVTGTIDIDGHYMQGGIVGQAYNNITNCSVNGGSKTASHLVATYMENDLEADKIGGIIGHWNDGKVGTMSNCSVANITIAGSRDVGGMVGYFSSYNILQSCSVSDLTITINAPLDYANSKSSKIHGGGVLGSIAGDDTRGSIEVSVQNIALTVENAGVEAIAKMGFVSGGKYSVSPMAGVSNVTDAGITVSGTNSSEAVQSCDNVFVQAPGVTPAVTYVAQIGEGEDAPQFATLDAAYEAADTGDTITLLQDITYGTDREVPVWGKAVNLDLNDHTLTTDSTASVTLSNDGYKAAAICYSIPAASAGNVRISNGTIVTAYGAGVYADDPGLTLTLENVTINAGQTGVQSTAEYTSAVRITCGAKVIINSGSYTSEANALTVSNSGGEFVINDGTFSGKVFSSYNNATAKIITINGGKFSSTFEKTTGTITINGGVFTNDAKASAESVATLGEGKSWIDNSDSTYPHAVGEAKTYVAQIGDNQYETLAEAIAAVPDGTATTIEMIADSTEPEVITIAAGKNITLDLAGHTISYVCADNEMYFITNKGTLTVQDSSAGETGKITAKTTKPDTGYSKENVTLYNLGGTLNLKSGTIENTTATGLAYAVNNSSNAWANSVVSTFNMTGGRLAGANTDNTLRVYQNTGIGWKVNCKNYVNISGGTIDNGIFFDTFLYTTNQDATGFDATDITRGCVIDSKVNISGGTVNGLVDLKIRHPYSTELNITGGDFANAKLRVRKYVSEYGANLKAGAIPEPTEPMVNISGGNFTFANTSEAFLNNSWASYTEAYTITGGTFNVNPETTTSYVADGYKAVDNGNGTWTVSKADVYTAAAAKATGTLYLGGAGNTYRFTITKNGTKLAKAAEYSAEKDNWELVYNPEYIELTNTDANSSSGIGYTVKALKAGPTTITFRNIADPTITASTVLTNKHAVSITYNRGTDASGNKYLLEKGALTITKITFDGVEYTGADLDTFLASHTLTPEGNATIDGLNVTPNATGNVYIHVTDKEDDTVTARSGLLNFINAVAQIGNDYYATLTSAFKAAQDGDTITLISDITEFVNFGGTAPRANEFALTLDLNGHTFTAPANENFALRVQYGVITIKDSVGTGGAIRYGKNSAILVDHLAGEYPSKVIIESGTFTGKSTVVQTGYPGGTGANHKYYGGELEVLGGTFITEPDTNEKYDDNGNFRYTLNMLDMVESNYAGGIYSPSSITVKGGTFNGFNPANNAAEGANTNFVAPGYEAVEVTSGTWQVGEIKASAIAAQETVTENYEATYSANKKVVDENDVTLAQDTPITINLKADDSDVSTGNVLNDQYDVSTIVAAIVEAEGAKASTLNVSISVVKDDPDVVEENNKKTVTYEVHPVATITNEDGDTLGTYTISNDQLAVGATFVIKLPVPEALQTSGYVKVTHKLNDDSTVVYGALAYDVDGFITIADVAEFSEFELEIAETVTESASYGFTLALKNKIEIPLYVYNLSGDASNYHVYYSYTDANNQPVEQYVDLSDSNYSVGNGWYRVVVASFSARQLRDEVTVILYTGNNKDNTDNQIYSGTYSIYKYCDNMINGGTNTASLITLCKAMMDYGTAAQWNFNYNTENLSSNYYYLNNSQEMGDEYINSFDTLHSAFFSYIGATLSLKSQTELNFYFTLKSGSIEDYTFKVNGVVAYAQPVGSYYKVTASEITAKNLDKQVTVTVTNNNTEEIYSYSPLNYAYYIQQNSTNDTLKTVCRGLYLYWQAANDYLN